MDRAISVLPAQFDRRAATASFIVDLFNFHSKHGTSPDLTISRIFLDLPAPPDHIDREMVDECHRIAGAVVSAAQNKYVLEWSAEDYANDVGGGVLVDPEHEASLMRKYPPLIDLHEVLNSTEEHLPIIDDQPAVITDSDGNVLVWSLPGVLPDRRQKEILKATRCIEAQLSTKPVPPDEAISKHWRSGKTFFSKSSEWQSGTTLLYAAGFAQGHTGPKHPIISSSDAKTQRAKDWMADFETSGGVLDGILTITHPRLYEAARGVSEAVWQKRGGSHSLMELWPTCFSSIQVIANRATPRHRDNSALPGWLDLLLSLGSYGENGVLELRNLGVCLPYDTGSVALVSGRLIVHAVPKVPGPRICYACYMNKHLFKRFKVPTPGMARVPSTLTSGPSSELLGGASGDGDGAVEGDEDADGSDVPAEEGTGA